MMVYVIDKRAPSPPRPSGLAGLATYTDSYERGWRRVIEQFPGHEDAQMLFVESNESFRDLAERIAAVPRNPWSIWLLRIVCHGAPAYLELGAGIGVRELRYFNRITHSMTPAHLRGRGLELHGCNVGEGNSGRRFIQRIAGILRLPVVASPNIQYADNMFEFEGTDIVRIDP